ncbi:flavin-binding monooxygenase-like family protein [Pochonia chlamydosporia 170]|uniref:Flavin-binding monooxygenase-like family protein n=1 Tax=Pochonia chlamydosporia 170 TaxID=1380566 RepID=A0A179F4E7_METCM|nr:flavin-binding monooxygenase-like family protein [Pochonia chlamydosporia 170]OAQ60241.1 flavin-binding monooxygenase-like family protein [Pochonia chlamydosporia 170]
MESLEQFDCVVIGAGLYGLAAAKQYHCTQPGASLVIFDSQASLGGTWANERLYPDLKSNNLVGTYEFPDFPLDREQFRVDTGQHIPGQVLNAYLTAYAERFAINSLIRLSSKVLDAEHQESGSGGWILSVSNADETVYKVYARRLIVATGLTSEPNIPRFDGQEDFGGKIFHGKRFLQNRETLETATSATIFGASKLAWDAVYSYAKAGVKVHWIVRASGHGPCWMSPSHVTPFKMWLEKLTTTRILTWFSPCIWGNADGFGWVRGFLHGTSIGRVVTNGFWKMLGNDVLTLNAYDTHPETAKLKPWMPAMFTSTSLSILNYETDFFEIVRSGNVTIHVGEIDHLSPSKVHLSDGSSFDSDMILAHTGWKQTPPIKFLPKGIERHLGIPLSSDSNPPIQEDIERLQTTIEEVDGEILSRFPRLQTQPPCCEKYIPLSTGDDTGSDSEKRTLPHHDSPSYMLSRFMVPTSEKFLRHRDIVFAGMVSSICNSITAHVQGLWISAYFSTLLKQDPAAIVDDPTALHQLRYETVLHNRFGKWRYPHDLGLDPRRKGGILSEALKSYGVEDYRGINDEWLSVVAKPDAQS